MFSVNEHVSQEDMKRAIKRLRSFLRYAKVAERALQQIESVGYYNGRIPNYPTDIYPSRSYGAYTTMKLSQVVPTDRSLAPDFQDIRVEVGEISKYTSRGMLTSEVSLVGPLYSKDNVGPGLVESREKIGKLFYKKNGLSFYPFLKGTWESGRVISITKKKDSEEMFKGVAEALAYAITRRRTDQFSNTMVEKLKVWTFEEGFAKRVIQDIRDQHNIMKVMDT